MNRINRVRNWVAKTISPKNDTVRKYHSSVGAVSMGHKLQELVQSCVRYDTNDPRDRMKIWELIIQTLPTFQRAIELQADFIGNVKVITENDALKAWIKDWVNTVPILFESNPGITHFAGLNNYVRQKVKIALRKGLQFDEEVYNEDGTMAGILMFPSENFDLVNHSNVQTLQYTRPGHLPIEIDTESDHFDLFGVKFTPGSLWGLSMVDGGEFFFEVLLQMLVSMKNNYIRDGSPIGINIFSLKNHADFTEADFELFVAKVQEIEKAHQKAFKDSELGKRTEVFARLPGDVGYNHSVYGEGLQASGGREGEIVMMIHQLAGLTGMPIELLGADTGGSGFSGEKWKIAYRLLLATVGTTQSLLKPRIKTKINNYLISSGAPSAWLNQFEVGFDEPDFTDAKEAAEVQKMRADALEKTLANVLSLWTDFQLPVEELNKVFEAVGIDYVMISPQRGNPKPPANV